jgi:hypothetical protein
LSFTFWFIGLVALAALVYAARQWKEKRSDRRARVEAASQRRRSSAEKDRLACLDLAKGLNAGAPASEAADRSALAADPTDSTGRPARARRSVEAAHGFDPDLPPPRKSSTAR